MKNTDDIYNQYYVDITTLCKNRKRGISGMMRVRNDAEFITTCVESCIDALDELIIVYNDCNDASCEIIKDVANRYPEKIKYYEYPIKIYAWNLNDTEIRDIQNGNIPIIHTLANYYNYALSKTTRTHVIKIDADQLYFTKELMILTENFRKKRTWIPNIREIKSFIQVVLFMTQKYPKIITINDTIFDRYKSFLFKLSPLMNIPLSLSGINVAYNNTEWCVTTGKLTNDLNILPPFNGEGDHLIFKVTRKTYFTPVIDLRYEMLSSNKNVLIEALLGIHRVYHIGFYWWHVNAERLTLRAKQSINKKIYPSNFIPITESLLDETLLVTNNDTSLLLTRHQLFRFMAMFKLKNQKQNIKRNLSLLRKIHSFIYPPR